MRLASSTIVVGAAWLAGLLLLIPLRVRPGYSPVESTTTIRELPLFALIFILWFTITLLGLSRPGRDCGSAWLVAIFGFIYLGFWTLHAPYGRFEDWANLKSAEDIARLFHVSRGGHYWPWPGLELIGSTVVTVTGLTPERAVKYLVVPSEVAYTLLLWLIMQEVVGNHIMPVGMATVAAVMANPFLPRFHFYPANFGSVILLVGILMMFRRKLNDIPAAVVIATAVIAITHFVTAIVMLVVIVVDTLERRRIFTYSYEEISVDFDNAEARSGEAGVPTRAMAALALMISWCVYWATPLVRLLGSHLADRLGAALALGSSEGWMYPLKLWAINVGSTSAPAWLRATRLFWIMAVYLAALVIALSVIRGSRAVWAVRVCAACLLVLAGLSLLAGFLSPGASEIYRYIQFGNVFAVPLAMVWLSRPGLRGPWDRALVCVVLGVLAFPSFLAGGDRSASLVYYPEQVEAGRWIATRATSGERRFAVGPGWSVILYYSPEGSVMRPPGIDEIKEDNYRGAMRRLHREYIATYLNTSGKPVFLWKDRLSYLYFVHWFGPQGAAEVLYPIDQASLSTNLVYANGFGAFFYNTARGKL